MTTGAAAATHRAFETELTVRRADGSPRADEDVLVEQVRHRFAFGNIGFDFVGLANGEQGEGRENVFGGADPEAARRLEDLWLDVFNTATLPFYWAASSRWRAGRTRGDCRPRPPGSGTGV
ncbi:hypothetical protein [Blastococcus sp. PRF04-17]|uniref:hypothetical protein n=1 Tax=Blastococcus sp. PRF04-17 TaxID=2933797 RepID=UPI001FF0ED08|nr:hypothetical protein [Blastococcus sp. PRF04-17]UOY02580.1 hypothetical protein MVA48_04190 [Blastococcus sp. PRF04-17]